MILTNSRSPLLREGVLVYLLGEDSVWIISESEEGSHLSRQAKHYQPQKQQLKCEEAKRNRRINRGFSLIIEMLSGFLFLFILILNLVMGAFGYLMEKDDYDPDADLQKINNDPKKFQIGIMLALVEHGSVIALAIMLFIVFSPYNIILGIVCIVFRIGEGLIQYINEPNYWRLINIARQYSSTSGAEKTSLSELARTTFKTKDSRFKFAMICWSIGTLAYSIVIATSEVVPQIIGWLGIIASILVGLSTGMKLVKPNFKDFTIIGGLTAILFEVIIGGWLLFSRLI